MLNTIKYWHIHLFLACFSIFLIIALLYKRRGLLALRTELAFAGIIVAAAFGQSLVWDNLGTAFGFWVFNPDKSSALALPGNHLPVEEVLWIVHHALIAVFCQAWVFDLLPRPRLQTRSPHPAPLVSRLAVKSPAVKSAAVPASVLESAAVPASALKSSAVKSSAVPASVRESSAVKSSALKSAAVPASALSSPHRPTPPPPAPPVTYPLPIIGGVYGFLALISLYGVYAVLLSDHGHLKISGLVALFFGPLFLFQWFLGYPFLRPYQGHLCLGTLIPSVYTFTADYIAQSLDIWSFSAENTLPIALFNLKPDVFSIYFATTLACTVTYTIVRSILDTPPPAPESILGSSGLRVRDILVRVFLTRA